MSKHTGAVDHVANARLIAAAPDLLEALQAFLLGNGPHGDARLAALVGEDIVRDARAAIAKATQ